ncbi:hypothetical protein IHE45_10G032600 [Dioscorea alata]|uniref:Uncharacterized protein n=1 Tax=Dioscorea alata TaxID=55571 RepID=A0ACB7VA97_DIOAL|nr:hypothetical protein IHE45_10G032600 [Dioscorea alata]
MRAWICNNQRRCILSAEKIGVSITGLMLTS